MKKLFLACLLACMCLSALGRDIRRIYVWDVTLSMIGKGGQDIWDITKKAINDDIAGVYDKNTEIIMIPFQHRLLTEDMISAYGDEAGKKKVMDFVSGYEIPRMWMRQEGREKEVGETGTTTQTRLSDPLMGVVDKWLDPQKRNVIMFLSDGRSDEDVFPGDQAKFDSLITSSALCDKLSEMESYLFYFALTEAAENETLRNYVLQESCSGQIIYIPTEATGSTKSIDIYSMIVELPREREFNVANHDNLEGTGIKFKLKNASSAPAGFRTVGYTMHVKSEENALMSIDQDVVIGEDLTFTVYPEFADREDIIAQLAGSGEQLINIEITVSDQMKTYPYNMTSLHPESKNIAIKLINTKQNQLFVEGTSASSNNEYFTTWDLWPFSYYTPDLARVNDVLTVKIVEDASNIDGPIVLALCDKYGENAPTDMVELYVDGEKTSDNKITIVPSGAKMDESLSLNLEVVLTDKALQENDEDRSFDYHFVVENTPRTLHVINDQKAEVGMPIEEAPISLCVDYTVNSLKTWFLTILLIVLAALAAIIIFVQCTVKRINKKHLISILFAVDDNQRQLIQMKSGLNGSAEIILTPDSKKKQGFIAMLFNGKKSYVYVAGLPVEIFIKPTKMGIRCSGMGLYPSMADSKMSLLSCENNGTKYEIKYPR